MDKKILILKNDRVGDLFSSIKGINSILNEHKDYKIEIILSNFSKDISFLFDENNIKVDIYNYDLNFYEKLKIIKKVFFNNYEKIFILTPKNIYFYLPIISNSKFYAVVINDHKRNRPLKFLRNKLFKFEINDRTSKRLNEGISTLTENLCNENSIKYPNILNNKPLNSKLLNDNIDVFKNFVHIHYKDSLYKNNGWTINDFLDLINKISKKTEKVFISSDFGNYKYNNYLLEKLSFINFENGKRNIENNSKIIYLHNIKINDLFTLIYLSNQVIAPHGTMTLMASYLNKKVIDLFDSNVSIIPFREYKPSNKNYNFLILKNNFDLIGNKIINFL